MEDEVGGVVDGAVHAAHRLLVVQHRRLLTGVSGSGQIGRPNSTRQSGRRRAGAGGGAAADHTVILANVTEDPQQQVEDLTGAPADDEGDDQQEEHLHCLQEDLDRIGTGGLDRTEQMKG